MLMTKGDLFDQESKLARSGLGEYFSARGDRVARRTRGPTRAIMARHG